MREGTSFFQLANISEYDGNYPFTHNLPRVPSQKPSIYGSVLPCVGNEENHQVTHGPLYTCVPSMDDYPFDFQSHLL